MAANPLAPEVKSTSSPTMAATPPSVPNFHDSALLTDRQKRRRLEKAAVKRGFQGNITIDSDPREATRHAHLEYLNASHWGDKDSRMVFWAKGSTHLVGVGLGIVSQTSPDPEK
jgi:ribosome modulation factor